MTQRPPPRPHSTAGLTLADIYFVLFRHKWMILILASMGILVSILLPLVWRLPYQSEAKLFVKYVLESKTPSQLAANSGVNSFDERSENVINTELEILTSMDLAEQVAKTVGPEKILAKTGGGNDKFAAAAQIRAHLIAEESKKSNVIRLTFQHPDAEIVQQVLDALIAKYLQAHGEIHRSLGVLDDFLSQETDQLRSRLVQTEDELRKAKAKAGILSLEDTKKVYTEQTAKIQQSIFDAEAELAERQATVNEMSRLSRGSTNLISGNQSTTNTAGSASNQPRDSVPLAVTNSALTRQTVSNNNISPVGLGLAAIGFGLSATNSAPSIAVGSPNATATFPATNAAISDAAIAEYRKVCTLLENLEKKEQDLLVEFTPVSPLVKSVRDQIDAYRNLKARLETENPGINTLPAAQPKVTEIAGSGPKVDVAAEMAKVTALQAKIKVLNNQLNGIRTNASAIDLVEGSITELQRRKELDEGHYKYFSANLEQSRIDEALRAAKFSNIIKIQAPSPPFQDGSKLKKLRLMALVGGIAAAIALAFLIELYLDRSLKRPTEIEAKLGLPLFISIPLLNGNGNGHRLNGFKNLPLLSQSIGNGHSAGNNQHETAGGEDPISSLESPERLLTPHFPAEIRPFVETLRDRLIAYFELNNLTHKPKLVAVTSCADRSGVSTVASGLAASLSETGDGNVLLVDMHLENGVAHDFHRGKLTCGLDDALELERRGDAMVQDNLYVVKECSNGNNLPRVLPKRFNHLMPRLRASDYDYIIFDMPAISQISVTARLSRFMDMVLLVVESEKTDRDVAKRAVALLSETKTNLAVVLNKRRSHVPRLLQQEL